MPIRARLLIDGAEASDATKVEFSLDDLDFDGNSLPCVKTVGLGSGDSVNIYEKINGAWQLGCTLDADSLSEVILSVGEYAVDIVMATAGPVSCLLNSPANKDD